MRYVAEAADAISEGDERQRRRQGEAEPRRESAGQTSAQHAENNADLTARRPRQELAERDDVGIGRFIKPLAALDEFGAEIPKMRDRAAKARDAQSKERQKHFEKARPFGRLHVAIRAHQVSRLRGGGAVNRAMSATPSACSISAICATASSNPSLPNCWRSISSNVSPISSS